MVRTLTQGTRGLPERSRDAYGSFAFLDDGYDYDSNANVKGISDGATGRNQRGSRTMNYDGLDRLTAVSSPMFTASQYHYDVLDNLQHFVIGGAYGRNYYYCYDGSNRLTNLKSGSCAGTSLVGLGYDVQGNLQNKNGVIHKFSQDNRLREVVGKEIYRYDNIRSFYNKAGQLAYQSDARKQKSLANVYLAGSLVATREQSYVTQVATVVYQHTDSLGTPVVVTDAARNVVERSEYEPYGRLLNRPIHDGPGYTGHVEDAQTGLTYMQQRYYDPGVGRFLSVDPLNVDSSTGQNFNRYSYGANSPYRFKDPDGRDEKDLALPHGLPSNLPASALEAKNWSRPQLPIQNPQNTARSLDKAADTLSQMELGALAMGPAGAAPAAVFGGLSTLASGVAIVTDKPTLERVLSVVTFGLLRGGGAAADVVESAFNLKLRQPLMMPTLQTQHRTCYLT